MVSGNILASENGDVGYLQPRGSVSSPTQHFASFKGLLSMSRRLRAASSSSSILQHLKVNNLFIQNTSNKQDIKSGAAIVNTILV